jgi:integrase
LRLNSIGKSCGCQSSNYKKPQRHFTPDESQRIIDAASEPWNICFAFMAYLGLRTSEAVGVAWEHVDLDAGLLRVRQSNWRGKLLIVKSKSSLIFHSRRCWSSC